MEYVAELRLALALTKQTLTQWRDKVMPALFKAYPTRQSLKDKYNTCISGPIPTRRYVSPSEKAMNCVTNADVIWYQINSIKREQLSPKDDSALIGKLKFILVWGAPDERSKPRHHDLYLTTSTDGYYVLLYV